jgi:hypothetical protein
MLGWLWRRLFPQPALWQRSIVELRDLEDLARSGLASMLLAQEKARLDYVQARETYDRQRGRDALNRMHDRLHHLQATSAIVQSLLNEHFLERLLAAGVEQTASHSPLVKSR